MPYTVELVSLGVDLRATLGVIAQRLNRLQTEFVFSLPPERLAKVAMAYQRSSSLASEIFDWLEQYRIDAKGSRPYLVAFTSGPLSSEKYVNLFGSHQARNGLAAVTTHDVERYVDSISIYLSYYILRYTLSFVAPEIRNHDQAKNCFFDRKIYRPDLALSLRSGRVCDEHQLQLRERVNEEIEKALQCMIAGYLADVHLSSSLPPVSGAPSIQESGNAHSVEAPAFVWIHVSDIHFGAGDDHWRFDQKAVARSIVSDVERCPWVPARIFVTGDLAFSGHPDQYVLALKWLAQLSASAKVTLESVRVVPGNHDVDRGLAGNVVTRNLHLAARERPRELDAFLQDETARNLLGAKLAAYQKFVSEIPGHPAPVLHGVDWTELLPATRACRGPIRVAGLSSVWVSDEWDGRTRTAPMPLVPNMLVGLAQLEATLAERSREEMVFLLTHHPVQWMAPDCATQLSSTLAPRAHVHLCGHVHDAQARLERTLGQRGASLRYIAGAAHGDPLEAKKHGYSWGAIRFRADHWQIGWAPRIYVVERGEMRPDSTRYDLDADGFAWDRLGVSWMQYAPRQPV